MAVGQASAGSAAPGWQVGIGGYETRHRADAMTSSLIASSSTTPLDGTWEMTADARYGIDAGRYRLVLRDGRWRLIHLSPPTWGRKGSPSVFSVRGDNTLRVHFSDGTDAIYRWNVFRETLTFRYTSEHVGPPNPTYAPWHRVGR